LHLHAGRRGAKNAAPRPAAVSARAKSDCNHIPAKTRHVNSNIKLKILEGTLAFLSLRKDTHNTRYMEALFHAHNCTSMPGGTARQKCRAVPGRGERASNVCLPSYSSKNTPC
jgi:hypothetical protein